MVAQLRSMPFSKKNAVGLSVFIAAWELQVKKWNEILHDEILRYHDSFSDTDGVLLGTTVAKPIMNHLYFSRTRFKGEKTIHQFGGLWDWVYHIYL